MGLSVDVLTTGPGERLMLVHLVGHQMIEDPRSLMDVHLVPEAAGRRHGAVTGRKRKLV